MALNTQIIKDAARAPRKLLWGGAGSIASRAIRSKSAPILGGVGLGLLLGGHKLVHSSLELASAASTGDPNMLTNAHDWADYHLLPTLALAPLNPIVPAMAQGYDAMAHENIQAYYGGPSAPVGDNPLYDQMVQQQMAYSSARASNPMSLNANGSLVFGLYNSRLK